MTTDQPSPGDAFDVVGGSEDQAHVTVTRVTEVVEVIDTVEVVETVYPDGEVVQDVVVVEHAELDEISVETVDVETVEVETVEVELVELESTELHATEFIADEDRVATQGALPLDVRTGDAGVDAAVAQLRDLDDRPVAEHAEVFTAVHRALQDALVDLDRN